MFKVEVFGLKPDYSFSLYFSLNRRFTKSTCDFATVPSSRMLRFLFLDFFVRMWRLKLF